MKTQANEGRIAPHHQTPLALSDQARDRLAGLARDLGWRLVVLFGSTAAGKTGRDLDLAVLPSGRPDLMELGHWHALLEGWAAPQPIDLLLITEDLSPITRFEVFRAGICLWEAEDGLFDRERDRAFFLYADSEWMRRQQGEVLRDVFG
ncbi:nucleotidyltransferase domain-containing protein [Thiohalocapsa marina]|uniref:nucleotidyltransferase domain-containing protein n=1 Tax=Thiohalocapsa marina TaxID=424902 RepID=UPI001478AE12